MGTEMEGLTSDDVQLEYEKFFLIFEYDAFWAHPSMPNKRICSTRDL